MQDQDKSKEQLIKELSDARLMIHQISQEQPFGGNDPGYVIHQVELVLNAAGEGIFGLDKEGTHTFVNPAAARMLGYKVEELLHHPSHLTWHYKHADGSPYPIDECPIYAAYDLGIISRGEDVFWRKDGTSFSVEFTSTPIWNEGKTKGAVVVFTDITERKQVEDALAQRAVQLSILNDLGEQIAAVLAVDTLLEKAVQLVHENFGYHHVAIFTLDEGGEMLNMRARAGEYAHLFPANHRLSVSQGMVGWVARNGRTLLANDVADEPRFFNRYPELITTRSEMTVPIRVGEKVIGIMDAQSIELSAFDEGDLMVMETLADQIAVALENARLHEQLQHELAVRKQAQQVLREHSERLEEMVEARTQALLEAQDQLVRREKLAVLGQLSGSLAHELRNPLAAISSAVYLLEMLLADPSPEVTEALAILGDEVQATERIIDGLLGFARTKKPARQLVDLNKLLADLMAHTAVPDHIQVQRNFDQNLPAIAADPGQLRHIFSNLIGNAIQAVPDRGSVQINTLFDKKETVITTVADTGVGIPQENIDKLFEPLFTTKARGIGLGLPLVKNLVEGHGGRIEVMSQVGQGSIFTVCLPLAHD